MKSTFDPGNVNLKIWAEREEWGRIQGTKEAQISAVYLLDSAGRESDVFSLGDSLTVRCLIKVQEKVKEPHFGVAIFREDGLYCFGPNTLFDNHEIKCLEKGQGWFSLRFDSLNLAPGGYRISVAIWDKKEVLAYSYHPAVYKFRILGENTFSMLACYNTKWDVGAHSGLAGCQVWSGFDPNVMVRSKGKQVNGQEDMVFHCGVSGQEGYLKDVFDFSTPVMLKFKIKDINCAGMFLAVGLFRKDGLLMHASCSPLLSGTRAVSVLYTDLNLLRGKYMFGVGIWNGENHETAFCRYGIGPFEVRTDKNDHGCLFFEHDWQLELP